MAKKEKKSKKQETTNKKEIDRILARGPGARKKGPKKK